VTGLSVHHVTLTVTDVDSSAQWYQRLLGPATVVARQGPSWRRIRLQWPWGLVIGVTCHDSTMESSFDCTRVGLDHLGLACADEAEVRWWLAHVDELGVEHGPLETPSYGWAVTARDPDGIAIEFFSPARAAAPRSHIDGVGLVSIRAIPEGHPRPNSPSVYEDWGEMAAEAMTMTHERWLIEVTGADGTVTPVGDMSAHAVWNGPTRGSRAFSIGISIVEDSRGLGIGAVAQRLLADELHARGVVRVEASTDVVNVAEQRALQKAGFECEGVLRSAQARRDGIHDLQVWSHIWQPPA
jgi:glyoxylase I family protein